MTEEQSVNIYVRITDSVLKRLDLACAELRLKRPAAVTQAIERWVSDPAVNPCQPSSGVPEPLPPVVAPGIESPDALRHTGIGKEVELWELFEKLVAADQEGILRLARIYHSRHAIAIAAINSNLVAFEELACGCSSNPVSGSGAMDAARVDSALKEIRGTAEGILRSAGPAKTGRRSTGRGGAGSNPHSNGKKQ